MANNTVDDNVDQFYLEVCRVFLEEYWIRSGRPSGELGDLLSSVSGSGRITADPALWYDWTEAVRRVRRGTQKRD